MTCITPSERIAVSSVRQMTDERSEPSQPAVGCLHCHWLLVKSRVKNGILREATEDS